MSDTVIQIENLSKRYRLGVIGGKRLVDDVSRQWARFRGRPDPLSKVTQMQYGARSRKVEALTDEIWALNNITFEVKQGEILGIIGRNGAGKSTLLKILSRVTAPTSGEVRIRGRIASLLEVGTGFHPELTGRENIFLNGAILGMTKAEIRKKFDEIVDFSEVERFIDTPVKRYSSGMYVRLAFAVAAHLDPEILIVDEVLAVGDSEFQKKCLGKMNEVSTNDGRTILFVSHNMASLENLCPNALILSSGQICASGITSDMIREYSQMNRIANDTALDKVENRKGNQTLRFVKTQVLQNGKVCNDHVESLVETQFRLFFEIKGEVPIQNARIDVGINSDKGQRVGWFSTSLLGELEISNHASEISFYVSNFNLAPGDYTCNIYCQVNGEVADWLFDVFPFTIIEKDYYQSGKSVPKSQGLLLLQYRHTIN